MHVDVAGRRGVFCVAKLKSGCVPCGETVAQERFAGPTLSTNRTFRPRLDRDCAFTVVELRVTTVMAIEHDAVEDAELIEIVLLLDDVIGDASPTMPMRRGAPEGRM